MPMLSVVHGGSDDGFTSELAELLCLAVKDSPSRLIACQAAGVTPATLAIWLQRGAQPDAPKLYRKFVSDFMRAEAQLARELFEKWLTFNDRSIMDYLLKRFPSISSDNEAMAIVQGAEQNAAARAALLDKPPPRMLAELHKRGWMRFPGTVETDDQQTLRALQRKYQERLGATCPETP